MSNIHLLQGTQADSLPDAEDRVTYCERIVATLSRELTPYYNMGEWESGV